MTQNTPHVLREGAVTSANISSLIGRASAASLFSKMAAIEACKLNPYQPYLVWHPTIFGSMMQLDLREVVSQQIFLTGAFEPDVVWFLTCVVDSGASVIDAGAHIGFFSLALGKLVGPNGRVDSFEPTPATKLVLDTNIRNSAMTNIMAHGVALWKDPGIVRIHDFGPAYSAYNSVTAPRLPAEVQPVSTSVLTVPAVSIDSFVDSSKILPTVVKLDVESSEYEVIAGMRNTLATHKPIIAIEIGDFEGSNTVSSYELTSLLLDSNYNLYSINNCRLSPFAHEERTYDYANLIAVHCDRAEEVLARTGSSVDLLNARSVPGDE